MIHDLALKTLIGSSKERDGVYQYYTNEIKVQFGHVGSLHTRDL